MSSSQMREKSKFLSYVLRHNPAEIGIKLDAAGWVPIDELLAAAAAKGKQYSRDELFQIVSESDKQRFAISDDGLRIRANQGHSVPIELGYQAVIPPAVLYHGTAERFVDSIRAQGLIKGQRHHVHMTESLDVASAVGQRYGKARILKIDAARMHSDGMQFYCSENSVWLTDHVPPAYIDFAN